MSAKMGFVKKCQICGNNDLQLLLDLGHQSIVQSYLSEKELHYPEITYPLRLVRCEECELLQIDYVVDPRLVFPSNYPYRTGLTDMLVKNFESLAETMRLERLYEAGDLIVDIGSNDGTLLSSFKSRGMRVVGVEPTDAAIIARNSNIETYNRYFDMQSAKDIVAKHGKAKIVTATNVFAHISDMRLLIIAIKITNEQRQCFCGGVAISW